MKTTFTKDDIPRYAPDDTDLGDGVTLRVETKYDDHPRTPWEDCGHGPVSEWTTREKRPGEWTLCTDRSSKRYYDFQEAVKIAKRDGWGAPTPPPPGTLAETKGALAVRAVESDFKLLQDWCEDRWRYIGVTVTLFRTDEDGEVGEEISSDSLWGIEDYTDYWRECAADMATGLVHDHLIECAESAYWAERDTMTVS